LTVAELRALLNHEDRDVRSLALRYYGMRLHHGGSTEGDAPAFTTLSGAPVLPAGYADHLRSLRRVRGAAEANAEMCRLSLSARITSPAPGCSPHDRVYDDDP
jgi:hypothetical protein